MDELIINLEKYKINHKSCVVNPKNKRIIGEKRELMSQEIKSMGITNFRAQNHIKTDHPIDYLVIRKLSSEHTHRFKLFNEVRSDADAAKSSFDLLVKSSCKKGIKGFIQEISISPFSMNIYSEIQLRMWDSIQKRNPVWYFDASGLFIPAIFNQKKPLLYSIVSYDPINKSLIPIADFFSTENDTTNISINLLKITSSFKKLKPDYYPKIIVTDFSWANINALLRIILNCDIIQYLKLSYNIAVLKDYSFSTILNSKIYICSTHFLKIIIDDLDDINITKGKITDKMRAAFIFCFTMLQNSSSIEEFNQNLEDMVTIFCQPKLSQLLLRSLVRMNIEISIRNYDWLNQLFKKFDRKFLITSKESRIEDIYFPNDMSKNYILDSPFTKFFEQRLSFYKKCIKEESIKKDQIIKTNEFYKPILMKIIEKRIHLVPLWSGILISLDKDNFPQRTQLTRLTNNPVESWFGYFRNNILDINKRLKFKRLLFPSEIVIPYYNYLSMKFEQFYEKDCIDFSKSKDGHNNSEEEEKWEFKKEKKITKEKGIYFTNKFTFGIDNLKQEDSLKTQFRGKSELFSMPLIDVENSEFRAEVLNCFRNHIFFYSNYSKITCKNVYELLNNDLLSDEVNIIFKKNFSFKI